MTELEKFKSDHSDKKLTQDTLIKTLNTKTEKKAKAEYQSECFLNVKSLRSLVDIKFPLDFDFDFDFDLPDFSMSAFELPDISMPRSLKDCVTDMGKMFDFSSEENKKFLEKTEKDLATIGKTYGVDLTLSDLEKKVLAQALKRTKDLLNNTGVNFNFVCDDDAFFSQPNSISVENLLAALFSLGKCRVMIKSGDALAALIEDKIKDIPKFIEVWTSLNKSEDVMLIEKNNTKMGVILETHKESVAKGLVNNKKIYTPRNKNSGKTNIEEPSKEFKTWSAKKLQSLPKDKVDIKHAKLSKSILVNHVNTLTPVPSITSNQKLDNTVSLVGLSYLNDYINKDIDEMSLLIKKRDFIDSIDSENIRTSVSSKIINLKNEETSNVDLINVVQKIEDKIVPHPQNIVSEKITITK